MADHQSDQPHQLPQFENVLREHQWRLRDAQVRAMHKLEPLLQNDPVVHTFWTHWLKGSFPSFEAMLIDLVCELARQRQALLTSEGRKMFDVMSITIPPDFKWPPSGNNNYASARADDPRSGDAT